MFESHNIITDPHLKLDYVQFKVAVIFREHVFLDSLGSENSHLGLALQPEATSTVNKRVRWRNQSQLFLLFCRVEYCKCVAK